jgi:hypothetical protein
MKWMVLSLPTSRVSDPEMFRQVVGTVADGLQFLEVAMQG